MSGLSFLSKLVEQIMADGVLNRDCLVVHQNEIYLFTLSKGMPTALVLLDLSAAFYTTPLGQVIRKYTGVKYHFLNTNLFIHLSPDSLKYFDRLKSCLNDIQVWMSENKLKLNPD